MLPEDSECIADMLVKAINKKIGLEFQEATQDAERNSEINLWDTLIGEGLDETNVY